MRAIEPRTTYLLISFNGLETFLTLTMPRCSIIMAMYTMKVQILHIKSGISNIISMIHCHSHLP